MRYWLKKMNKLLKRFPLVAKTKKPIIVSNGLANIKDLNLAVKTVSKRKEQKFNFTYNAHLHIPITFK